MNILVLTGADERMKSIADLTSANQKAYALRHGFAFERVTEYPKDCHPSWHKIKMIQDRLPFHDAILWMDADTLVTDPEFNPFEVPPGVGLTVSADWTCCEPDKIGHFSLGNFIITNSPASFMILELASQRTRWKNEPLWEQQAIQEEYRANEEIRKYVHILPRQNLNAVPSLLNTAGPEPWEPGDFLCHITFQPIEVRCKVFHEKDRSYFQSKLPEWHETVMCADARHIACIREICISTQWKSALEIGCWTGCSTTALIEGMKAGKVKNFTACDVGWTDEFRKVIAEASSALLMQRRSVEVLAGPEEYDLMFIDGDHSLETGMAETLHVLRRQPRCVLAHDVNAMHVGFGNCEGSAHLMEELKKDGWTCIVDQKVRPGEKTERGFMAATKDQDLIPLLQRAFDMTCY